MRQKQKKLIFGILIVVALAIFILSMTGFKLPFAVGDIPSDLQQYVGKCSGGFTTLGISDVNIIADSSTNRIRILGIAKGSECLKIQFNQNELNDKLKSQGYASTKDIVGNIRLLEYTKTFPISQNGDFKGNLNNVLLSGTKLSSTKIQTCIDKGYPNTIIAYKPIPLITDVRCVVPGSNGISGQFVGTSYGNFKVQFDFDGESTVVAGRPTSKQEVQQSVSLRNGDIRIEWVGLLGNLDDVSTPQYGARLINSRWDLVQSSSQSEINGRLIDNFKRCINYQGLTELYVLDGLFDSCKSQFDSASFPILQSKFSDYKYSASNLVYDASTDSNALYVSLKSPPFPAFIIDLNAKSVGIISLQGKPKIQGCVVGQNLDSGKNAIVSYSVLNDANVNNVQFLSNIVCSSGISAYSTSFNIGANEQKYLTAELVPSNPNQQILVPSCTLTVKDLKSGNSDSCSFNENINYVSGIVCQANSLSCSDDGKNVVQCSSDGKNKVLKTECNLGCNIDSSSGGARCVSKTDSGSSGGFFDGIINFFKNLFGGIYDIYTILKYVVVGIVFIFIALFSKDLLGSFKSLRRNNTLSWILALIIGAGLAYFVFVAFVIGLIASVIVLIISTVNPFKRFM